MNRKITKYTFLLLFLAVFLNSCQEKDKKQEMAMTDEDLTKKAQQIQDNVITLDTHNDFNVANFTDSINYTQDLETQVNLPKMKSGGLDVSWLIVYTGQDSLNEAGYEKAYENAMSKFKAIHHLVEDIAPDQIALATTSEEVRRIHAEGKKVAMIGVENAYPIGEDISNVQKFYDLGARYMSLAHNGHSQLSDSNTGEADSIWLHNGLSDMGREVVKKMNELGMMIDVSHPSKEAMRQMIELTKAPIIASHSSARAMSEHSRNLDDEQLKWMKENGGVVQTVAFKSYLNKDKNDAREKARKELGLKLLDSMGITYIDEDTLPQLSDKEQEAYNEKIKSMAPILEEKMNMDSLPPAVNVQDFVDHIDYLVEKLGIDHVGISSDFDGGGGVEGWNDASETLNVTKELVRRGYTEEEIGKFWSGNLLRVLDEVQEVAQRLKSETK
ncbi:dipeptidase [Flavimarina sp. Hel_I_48]|uniref:dipeptidase n=1 Tax=Flavimarina sp. Hel_I_48 TaxID=1392488 RepID=UPI0004DEFB34|nr:dipeptidase [Flavimarina sp. Hel_I_48]